MEPTREGTSLFMTPFPSTRLPVATRTDSEIDNNASTGYGNYIYTSVEDDEGDASFYASAGPSVEVGDNLVHHGPAHPAPTSFMRPPPLPRVQPGTRRRVPSTVLKEEAMPPIDTRRLTSVESEVNMVRSATNLPPPRDRRDPRQISAKLTDSQVDHLETKVKNRLIAEYKGAPPNTANDDSEIVTVRAGPNRDPIRVPKDSVLWHSPYLRRKIIKGHHARMLNDTPRRELILDEPHLDPAGVKPFRSYISNEGKSIIYEQSGESLQDLNVLGKTVTAYAVGAQIEAEDFQDTIINQIVEAFKTGDVIPPVAMLATCLNTPTLGESSKIFELFFDRWCYTATPDEDQANELATHLSRRLLARMVKDMAAQRTGYMNKRPNEAGFDLPWAKTVCEWYHLHSESKVDMGKCQAKLQSKSGKRKAGQAPLTYQPAEKRFKVINLD